MSCGFLKKNIKNIYWNSCSGRSFRLSSVSIVLSFSFIFCGFLFERFIFGITFRFIFSVSCRSSGGLLFGISCSCLGLIFRISCCCRGFVFGIGCSRRFIFGCCGSGFVLGISCGGGRFIFWISCGGLWFIFGISRSGSSRGFIFFVLGCSSCWLVFGGSLV